MRIFNPSNFRNPLEIFLKNLVFIQAKVYKFYFREPDPNDPLTKKERTDNTPEAIDGQKSVFNTRTEQGLDSRNKLTKRVKGLFGFGYGGKNKTKKVNRKRSN
jgi:hypothetical protein